MPRERVYQNNAQRQAAYRDRHADRQSPREDLLAALARSFHSVLGDAVRENRSVLPARLLGRKADETLRNLLRYVRDSTPEQRQTREEENAPT